jgi:alginate O-acetyltransferase complex protein AlgJ
MASPTLALRRPTQWSATQTGIAAVTLIAVMAFGCWQIIGALRNPEPMQLPSTVTDFREGRTTQGLEKKLDHRLPAREALIAFANSVRYMLTRGGGDQVRVGRDGWLFLTDELRFDGFGQEPLQARAAMLGAASKALSKEGVTLVVALVPDKARVYGDRLSGGAYPAYQQPRYADGLRALRGQGVVVADLLPPLVAARQRQDVFYRTDTHWNQAGAQVSADAIAQAVRGTGASWQPVAFTTTASGEPQERAGDLIRLMGLADVPNAFRPQPDTEAPATTRQTSPDSGGGGLFGDAAVPVVLVGTSYSMRANFHGYLQQALSAKVLNTAKDGGGFLQAATAYLSDDAFRTSKPKVIVWELPERFLLNKLEAEQGWLEKVGLAR